MRISTLLLNDIFCSEITILQNNNSYSSLFLLVTFIVLVFGFFSSASAQWVEDPGTNTKLVVNTTDPVNISSVKDFNGGAFIFWQDKKKDSSSEVYFIHVDADGTVSLRADGKDISTLKDGKENPVCSENLPNSAVVIWKDFSESESGSLFAQRVSANGDYLWNEKGVQLTDGSNDVYDYSIASDKKGNVFISYITKNAEFEPGYKVIVNKINPDGNFDLDSTVTVSNSQTRKNLSKVVPDNLGGCYIFWVENLKNKSILFVQHINKSGKTDWHKNPVRLSEMNINVIDYTAISVNSNFAYAAWQILDGKKIINHQLMDNKGNLFWGSHGKTVAIQKGSQLNPEAIANDSSIMLSWTYDLNGDQDIYIQKYNFSGKPLWNKEGNIVINLNNAQFGQKIVSDENSGAIVSWFDRRKDSTLANIYSQRVGQNGTLLWDSLGVEIFANDNSQKSYLSLIPNESGAIAIIKEKLNRKNEIYGQRIFDSGTFASRISDFKSELQGDSVKLSWYSQGELSNTTFNIQRSVKSDSVSIPWQSIGTISEKVKEPSKYFEYFDKPVIAGTIYYKVTETDSSGLSGTSEVQKINYSGKPLGFSLDQNIPNPFSDSTTISFYLPQKENVTFEFYNNHLDLIQDTTKAYPAGKNSITFVASGLATGIYFYRMKVQDFIDVRKMVITK